MTDKHYGNMTPEERYEHVKNSVEIDMPEQDSYVFVVHEWDCEGDYPGSFRVVAVFSSEAAAIACADSLATYPGGYVTALQLDIYDN